MSETDTIANGRAEGTIEPTALEHGQDLLDGGIGQDRKAEMVARVYYGLDEQHADLLTIKYGGLHAGDDPIPREGHPSGLWASDKGKHTEKDWPDVRFLTFDQQEQILADGIKNLRDAYDDTLWKMVTEKLPSIRAEMDQRRKQMVAQALASAANAPE